MFSPTLAMVSAIASAIGDLADRGREDLVDVGPALESRVRDHFHEALEQVVAGDEIGLGIDLDHDALVGGHGNADQAFGGDAPGLLRGLGQAFLAQPVDRGFELPPLSLRAALQSIMPAPVWSRSSFTMLTR